MPRRVRQCWGGVYDFNYSEYLLQLHLVDGTGLVSDEHTEKQADAVIREVKKIASRMQRAAEAKKT